MPEFTLHTDVRDLLFADWADVVTFREVSAVYDPQHAEAGETSTDTLLLAIVGPRIAAPQPDTAHQSRREDRVFLIRAEDIPEEASLASSRILHRDAEYAILTADLAPGDDVLALSTVRMLPASVEGA
jgi:hypothetical protein